MSGCSLLCSVYKQNHADHVGPFVGATKLLMLYMQFLDVRVVVD